ncbi:putative phosphate starvation-inducible protein [Bacillus phage BSP36]|uniref:Putative phosphate starvation-inducible protein n=1 Tax=Bacillus phage BSP38 TaxID=2283013 RepID=A0A345MJQ6_BPBSP|nr:PhoH family protein [Bacillus phage BSP38]AXH71088.1 putative phosphate starvation-inducible protein [Bacillus phage BSP38]AYJ75132.1 putative phosphate starvation-inducible protein [Bacillus phage BSP36]
MTHKESLDLSKLTKKDFPLINKLDREQEDMVIKLFKSQRVIVDSVAGSGKTTVLTQAMKVLKDKGYIDAIYYVVFPVQEQSLGFLPGGVSEKIKEYAVPFHQALVEAGENPQMLDIEMMCDEFLGGEYKVVPHTFLRGRTKDRIGVIIDEAQNGTVDELRKVLTRITDTCYVGLAGHNGQIDISKDNSGFSAYIHHFKRGKELGVFPDIEFAELTTNYRGKFSSFSDEIGKFMKN